MKLLLAMTGLFALAAFSAADPPPRLSSFSPRSLVQQLGSESYARREAAMAALKKLGIAAVPALESALRSSNPEVGRRAAEALAAVRRADDSKRLLAVKRVRLSYRSMPLAAAIHDLKARTGIALVLDPATLGNPSRVVSVETAALPPWEALEAFCRAAGLKEVFPAELKTPQQAQSRHGYYLPPPPPPNLDEVPVHLAVGRSGALPGNRSTAVRVLALPKSFPGNRVYLGTGEYLLNFDIAPLPGIHFRDVCHVRITKVIDSEGRLGGSSSPKETSDLNGDMDPFAPLLAGQQGALAFQWDTKLPIEPSTYPNPRIVGVPIRVATPSARSLKLLEGAVVGEIDIPNQAIVAIDDIRQKQGIGVSASGDIKLTVLEAKSSERGGTTLKVRTEMPLPWDTGRRFRNPLALWDPPRPAGLSHRVQGFDAEGKPVRLTPLSTSSSLIGSPASSLSIEFVCPDGLPKKLVLMGPRTVLVEAPFRMENVPLP